MHLWIGEIIVSAVSAATALFFFIQAGSFKDLSTNQLDVGSRAFPRLIAILLLVCSIWEIIHALRKTKYSNQIIDFGSIPTVVTGSVLLAVYIFLFKAIGYFYATPVFIFLVQFIQGSRKWTTMIAISIGFSLFAYLVFVRFLGVALP